MEKTILVVEDEPCMRTLLRDYLTREGYRVLEAESGREALGVFRGHPPDLVLLDIMLPQLDGYRVCWSIRSESDCLIVMLTAKSEDTDKLYGYDLGADDYVTKPFSPKVLMAKTRALFKRRDAAERENAAHGETLSFDGLTIDTRAHEVRLNGETIALSPKEYELLLCLCRNRNVTLSRERLLDRVWGFDYDGDVRTVDTHIKRLRQKLRDRADLIQTVIGFGYKFRVNR